MSKNSSLIKLVGLVAIASIILGVFKKDDKENFMGVPQRIVVRDPLVDGADGLQSDRSFVPQVQQFRSVGNLAAQNNAQTALAKAAMRSPGSEFVAVANFQQQLQDRFSSTGLTPYINYKKPDSSLLGTKPMDPTPLSHSAVISESYVDRKPDAPKKAMPTYLDSSDLLPLNTMNSGVDDNTPMRETVNYDRLIYSPLKSRLLAQSDFFRGDLAIPVTDQNMNGTVVRTNRNPVNLNSGALFAMGGSNLDNAKQVAQLQAAYGGVVPAGVAAGSPVTGTVLKELGLEPHRNTLVATAFP